VLVLQKIREDLREEEDTFEFLAKLSKGERPAGCRSGKRCNNLCVRSSAICHILLDKKLSPALDRMRAFLSGRKEMEAEITVAAKDAILAFKAQTYQQLSDS
jgi:hypothetical protein